MHLQTSSKSKCTNQLICTVSDQLSVSLWQSSLLCPHAKNHILLPHEHDVDDDISVGLLLGHKNGDIFIKVLVKTKKCLSLHFIVSILQTNAKIF